MINIVMALALLGGPATDLDADSLNPYKAPILAEHEAESALIGGLSFVVTAGVIVQDELEDFNDVDFDASNTWFLAVGLWYQINEQWVIDFRLKYEQETEFEDISSNSDDVTGMELSVNAVLLLPTPAGMITPFLTLGVGGHRFDGDLLFDDDVDISYNGGGGLLIKAGSGVKLVIELRYVYIDLDAADPLERWQGGVGLMFGL
jgi:opacity protein-like surface antigen